MFCVRCGVKLGDAEKKCPLCDTEVYHPTVKQEESRPLYPKDRLPKTKDQRRVLNGIVIIMFLIPLFICLLADLHIDKTLDWFGFSLGALMVGYIIFALPYWFKKRNPVIFVPIDFLSVLLFLLYINIATDGNWFLSFALPLTIVFALIVCTMVTLTHYLRKGFLYIFGGELIAIGAYTVLVELLLDCTFGITFIGWSFYPLIVLFMLGGALIYLAINANAREAMERKLFF